VYVNVSVSRLPIPDCLISNVLFLCMPMSVSLDCPFLIVISEKDVRDITIMYGQSTDTDINIHKKKTLEIEQSGMDNLETMTLTFSLDCPFLIVPSLRSFSCVCQCQCL
jgi:hypothetical protein